MSKKNPIEEFQEYKQKEATAKARQDLQDWQTWHEGGRKAQDLQPLIKRYTPLINRKTREFRAPSVNEAAMKAELQKQLIGAAHDFDPDRGVAFNTYVQHRLQKAQRYNTRYQNVGYIPEGQARHIGRIQAAQADLSEQLGRDATPHEISVHLNQQENPKNRLTPKRVETILSSVRKDVPSSAFESDPIGTSSQREDDVIRMIGHRPGDFLDPDEARVFQHIYGVKGSKKITRTKDLADTLGTSQSRISRLKNSIADKIKKHL